MKGVIYRGELLAKGSTAFELHEAKNWKALDRHLAQVNQKAVERGESRAEPTNNPDQPH